MKTKTINLYSFKELSEEAQEKAIEKLWDLNVDHQWWEITFEDAKQIGLEITEFELDRGRYAKGTLIESLPEVCNLIMTNHGEQCETYKTAQQYLAEWNSLVAKYSDGVNLEKVTEENEYDFDQESDQVENEFLKSLLEDYSIILQKDYEFLTSREAILESIEANEYTFTEDGNLENA